MIATSRDPMPPFGRRQARGVVSAGRCASTSAAVGGASGGLSLLWSANLCTSRPQRHARPGAVGATSGIFSPAPHLTRNSAGFCYHSNRSDARIGPKLTNTHEPYGLVFAHSIGKFGGQSRMDISPQGFCLSSVRTHFSASRRSTLAVELT